ncbi:DNA-processing protein DprA [Prevotella pectinovora]|uniref:DNA-processing protein DprA n=1 Tax=Prevotella pectinovora TaxID=1602169 RepID=UPI0006986637|nr:DNA-processing protein DprA [Prevotella pectinovora]
MAQIITINKEDEFFPEAFKAIGEDCPERIYAMGNLDLLKREHMVAIIGSRKATRTGNSKAYDLGISYAKKGYVVVSGLALGCDASAHRGCMAADGGTIAIVATGLNLVHPRENIPLQEEILRKGGLILSEQPLGVKANPTRLVSRNRLQAALSEEVIVAECPKHSGTMHTVRFAQKYGKKVKAARLPYDKEENSGNKYIIDTGIGEGI